MLYGLKIVFSDKIDVYRHLYRHKYRVWCVVCITLQETEGTLNLLTALNMSDWRQTVKYILCLFIYNFDSF